MIRHLWSLWFHPFQILSRLYLWRTGDLTLLRNPQSKFVWFRFRGQSIQARASDGRGQAPSISGERWAMMVWTRGLVLRLERGRSNTWGPGGGSHVTRYTLCHWLWTPYPPVSGQSHSITRQLQLVWHEEETSKKNSEEEVSRFYLEQWNRFVTVYNGGS